MVPLMGSRILVVICAVVAILAWLGPQGSATEARSPTRAVARPSFPEATGVRASLVIGRGAPQRLVLRVTNDTRRMVELRFPDGQTHDFVVFDTAERAVWRWSDGRMFTQALRTRAVGVGESVEYADSWPARAPSGRYTVVATLRSETHPLEARQAIVIP